MNEQQIREAILDVIDAGDPKREDGHGRFCNRWQLNDPNEEIANQQRLNFCDAVIAKLKTTSLSPEDAAKLENATISERFNHAHLADVLRVQKQIG